MKTVYNADGVEFTIYETVKKTKAGPIRYWLLEDHSSGKRRLLSNKTKEAAQKRADKIRAAMVKGRADRMALSNGQWQDVCLAGEIVKSLETGDSLISAVREWAHCRALLLSSGTTPLEAVEFYRTHHKGGGGGGHSPTRFAAAVPAYHQSKVKSGQSQSHCKNILTRLGRLEKVLPADVLLDDLTAGQLDTALLTLDIGPKTRNEYRLILSNFYRWAGKQNPPLVPPDFNPAQKMERHRVGHQDVEFLRVHDLRKVLAGVQSKRPDLLMLVALICFAGIRPSEVVRLDWRDIGADYIRLPGNKTKTSYSRQIPIQPNLRRWLALGRKENGLVCPNISLVHINPAILRVSGVKLPHDGLRHSYASHRQQIIKSVAALADELGNGVAVCRRHYLNAFVSEQEARDWFNIVPPGENNIIALNHDAMKEAV